MGGRGATALCHRSPSDGVKTPLEARHGDDEGFPARRDAGVGRRPDPVGPLSQRQRICLCRRDQERADKIAYLQCLIDEGLGSGVGERSVEEVRAEARRGVGCAAFSIPP